MTNRAKWVWMPHPGHFICAKDCKFHLNTCVGGYVVSTVGEMLPDSAVREIFAKVRGISLTGKGDEREADYMRKLGYEKIGMNRLYETMVFKALPAPPGKEQICCPWRIDVSQEVDFAGYNEAGAAYLGHMALCEKWGAL